MVRGLTSGSSGYKQGLLIETCEVGKSLSESESFFGFAMDDRALPESLSVVIISRIGSALLRKSRVFVLFRVETG